MTGQRFALREGGRTVGAGVVSKVLDWVFVIVDTKKGVARTDYYLIKRNAMWWVLGLLRCNVFLGAAKEIVSGLKWSKFKRIIVFNPIHCVQLINVVWSFCFISFFFNNIPVKIAMALDSYTTVNHFCLKILLSHFFLEWIVGIRCPNGWLRL
jgi:hypothetical protein